MSDKDNDIAKLCECGSVNFALLKSGSVECNQCGEMPRLRWAKEDHGANLNAYAKRVSETIKGSGCLDNYHYSELSTLIDEILKYSIIGASK